MPEQFPTKAWHVMKKKGNDDIEDNDDETARQEKVLVHQKCLPSAAVHRPTICILISYILYLLFVFVSVPLFVFLYLISSYIALRAGLSTQSSCATRVFKDGGDDQRESQVKLLLQRQIHRHKKTNTQRHW